MITPIFVIRHSCFGIFIRVDSKQRFCLHRRYEMAGAFLGGSLCVLLHYYGKPTRSLQPGACAQFKRNDQTNVRHNDNNGDN